MFAVVLTYIKPIEEIDRLRPAHLAFLDRHYERGIFLASGRQVPLKGGVILVRGSVTRTELEMLMREDPFYTENAANFEIIEFTPNRFHSALEVLI